LLRATRASYCSDVGKLLGLIGASAGGAVGWWAGARVGFMTAFIVSVVGTGAGIYAARRVHDHYFG
jgi:hypothetical protein